MKVEQLLAQYLYDNKTVTLQDIGSFQLASNSGFNNDTDKETQLAPGSIIFNYDPHARLDEGLVDFIVKQTRKIKPLASSDLESYSILGKQFLNIGKPFHIEGVGTLLKSQEGIYEFTQGQTINPRLEAPVAVLREKQQEEIDFASPEQSAPSKKGWVLGVVILFVLIAGAALYYYLRNQPSEQPVEIAEQNADTPVNILPATTDTLQKADTSFTQSPNPVDDGYSFKVVIKEYPNKQAADKAFDKLSSYGHKLILSTRDSITYRLSIPFTSPLSDTTRAKDSLSKFFQSKAYIE